MPFAIARGLRSLGHPARRSAIHAHRRRISFITQPPTLSVHCNDLVLSAKSYTTKAHVTSSDSLSSKMKSPPKTPITDTRFLVPGRQPGISDDISRESDRRIQELSRLGKATSPRLVGYKAAQANGFRGTFFEYEVGIVSRSKRKNPRETPWITTLRPDEGLARDQFICLGSNKSNKHDLGWKGYVLFEGQILRRIFIPAGGSYSTFPLYEDVCPYILPKSYILRLRRRDGSDHEHQVDLRDGMYRPWCRTLADLAAKQNLIEPIKSNGYVMSFDFEANLKAQYRLVFMHLPSKLLRHRCTGGVRLMPKLGTLRVRFHIQANGIRKPAFPKTRGFFYIDSKGMMMLWDVDREEDICWKVPGHEEFSTTWNVEAIKKCWPELFAHAQHLGYWSIVS